jgi:signal transduction histidine kinase
LLEALMALEKTMRLGEAEKTRTGISLKFAEREHALLEEHNAQILQQKSIVEEQSSEIARKNEQLQTTNRELEELQEFREMMLGMIVHDLKNPLATIIGLAELDPVPETLFYIRQSAYSMLHLVRNILDLQRFESATLSLNLDSVYPEEMVEYALGETAFFIEDKKLIVERIGQCQRLARCDADIIRRVIINLLTNAIKYSHENGKLRIEVIEQGPQWVRVSVEDYGHGMKEAVLKSLFERFQTNHQGKALGKMNSNGLGLAFCKLAINAHGGEINVRSEVGKGSCFSFTIPADTPNARIDNSTAV